MCSVDGSVCRRLNGRDGSLSAEFLLYCLSIDADIDSSELARDACSVVMCSVVGAITGPPQIFNCARGILVGICIVGGGCGCVSLIMPIIPELHVVGAPPKIAMPSLYGLSLVVSPRIFAY